MPPIRATPDQAQRVVVIAMLARDLVEMSGEPGRWDLWHHVATRLPEPDVHHVISIGKLARADHCENVGSIMVKEAARLAALHAPPIVLFRERQAA